MDRKKVSVKCFVTFIFGVFVFISVSVCLLDINVITPTQLISTKLKQQVAPVGSTRGSVRKTGLTSFPYSERQKYYHNTMDLDYFHTQDFHKEPPPDSKLSSPLAIHRAKVIRAERLYVEKVAERNRFLSTHLNEGFESLDSIFKPFFNCPFLKENIGEVSGHKGDENWVCGFEVFRTHPRPQECVVYVFGGAEIDFERKWVQRTDCKVFKYTDQEVKSSNVSTKLNETFPDLKITKIDKIDEYVKNLRNILQNDDLGWLDVMVLDIGEAVYDVLTHLIKEFEIQVLPFAQIIVNFPTGNQKRFTEMFTKLEGQRLRPFHVSSPSDQMLRYSFFNLRGKHLILVGSDD